MSLLDKKVSVATAAATAFAVVGGALAVAAPFTVHKTWNAEIPASIQELIDAKRVTAVEWAQKRIACPPDARDASGELCSAAVDHEYIEVAFRSDVYSALPDTVASHPNMLPHKDWKTYRMLLAEDAQSAAMFKAGEQAGAESVRPITPEDIPADTVPPVENPPADPAPPVPDPGSPTAPNPDAWYLRADWPATVAAEQDAWSRVAHTREGTKRHAQAVQRWAAGYPTENNEEFLAENVKPGSTSADIIRNPYVNADKLPDHAAVVGHSNYTTALEILGLALLILVGSFGVAALSRSHGGHDDTAGADAANADTDDDELHGVEV